jgi:predicted NBD/HSP70 family sugar kinase
VGGAIVSGGRLYRGAAGFAGEIGHIRAHEHGAVCGCGNRGCLGPTLSESLLEPGAVRDASYQLGRALANLSNVLNPAAIVLGNVPAGARDVVVAAIHEAIDDYALRPIANTLSVRLAELDQRAGLLGALALAPVGYG